MNIENISCKKVKFDGKDYIRVEDEIPIWFVWSDTRSEYQTSYNIENLEKQYAELINI